MSDGRGVEVSVVVPTFRGEDHIDHCLRSLARQTLASDRYEVVVVQNGPADGTPQVLDRLQAEFPKLRLRRVRLAQPGAGRARNVGLHAARGDYMTFVDDDDSVSPEYLETLLHHSGPDTVGLAILADVTGTDEVPNFDIGPNRWQFSRHGLVPAQELPSNLSYTVGKMAPTALARAVGFDTSLRSGEDIVFWVQMLATAPFYFDLCAPDTHAVYYRSVRPNSVSRQTHSFDFSVIQRLDVIERLERVQESAQPARTAAQRMISAQTGLMNNFLRAHPDQHLGVVKEIRRRGVVSVPYNILNRDVARDLAILYVALPFSDTSALVAARRIRSGGMVMDVVSSDMSPLKQRDDHAWVIWQEFVDRVATTRTVPASASWPRVNDFCRAGMEQIAAWEESKGPYRSIYSRAMWPASHLLAALYKIQNPQTPWIAEFSDPLLHGIHGQERQSSGRVDPHLMSELRSALVDRGFTAPDTENMYVWLESLAYALADTVLFTNENQRSYMLGYCADPALVERALQRSRVEAQPTLPRQFYEMAVSHYVLDPTVANIAYFGVFYATRGLTEIVAALQSSPLELRRRLKLHVFTAKPDELNEELRAEGLGDVVVANPYVSYLEFLHLTTLFDALLVNDARTSDSHAINPYLPSKLSDYMGSGTPIWGVVEPGSIMSTLPLTYRSTLGDVEGARAVLEQIVREAWLSTGQSAEPREATQMDGAERRPAQL